MMINDDVDNDATDGWWWFMVMVSNELLIMMMLRMANVDDTDA